MYNNIILWFYKDNSNSSEVYKWDFQNAKHGVERKRLEYNFIKEQLLGIKYCQKGLFSFPTNDPMDSKYTAVLYNPENDSISRPSIFEYKEVENEFTDPYEEQKDMQRKMIFRDKNLIQFF